MPIIDSRSDSKFDALVRTNKADSLMSFIMASYNVKTTNNRKLEVAKRLKSAYELYKENVKGSNSGAGTYGQGDRNILNQFESHYTMGYEMGIWQDSDFTLCPLACKVAQYQMTVKEYIGIVFTNLFAYYSKNGTITYHHFLYEILKKAKNMGNVENCIPKNVIVETLPIEKNVEQGNMIFNYLLATDFFELKDKDILALNEKKFSSFDELISLCNLEYKDKTQEEAIKMAKDKKLYSDYVTKFSSEVAESDGTLNKTTHQQIDESTRIITGKNILLYGVPGSGKSWTIEHEYCKAGTKVERLVFYPDYTNSDFIGQILPVVDPTDKMVTYEFTSGPFTNILRDAYKNPTVPYVLIIEEINRGNAPAIFGDIFQLLDRTVEERSIDGIIYSRGTSEYGITNENIAKVVYNDEKHKVRIPSNLSILGTMNTSDQNVFTLDTAFQRRWSMRLIENNFDNVRPSLANAEILDTKITWQKFCETVNKLIVGNSAKMASAEDKRLGVYFIHENDLEFDDKALPTGDYTKTLDELNDLLKVESAEKLDIAQEKRLEELREAILHNRLFPEKVIKYLWDDAFKFNHEALFDTETMDSLEKVIRTFVFNTDFDRFKIFRQSVRDSLKPNQG